MKNTMKKRAYYPAHPNAKDHCFWLSDLVDGVLTVVTGIGAVTALTFLLLL